MGLSHLGPVRAGAAYGKVTDLNVLPSKYKSGISRL